MTFRPGPRLQRDDLRGPDAASRLPSSARLVRAASDANRRSDPWTGAYLRIQPRVWAVPRPCHHDLPVLRRSAAGIAVLDHRRLHLAVLDNAIGAEAYRPIAAARACIGGEPDLCHSLRLLLLRRCQLAFPALAAHCPAAGIFLSRRAALACLRC